MSDNMIQGNAKGKNTGMAVVAYILFFIPLLTDAKNDPFVKYHVKQGLVLFICYIIVMILSAVLPYRLYMITWLLELFLFILFLIGVAGALKGEQKPLPLIGQFADKFKI